MSEYEFLRYIEEQFENMTKEMKEQVYLNWYTKEQIKEMTIEFLDKVNEMKVN